MRRRTRRRLIAGAIGVVAAVVGAAVVITVGGGSGGGGPGSRAAHAIPGAFRLSAAPGDGAVWLAWQTVSGCAPVNYEVQRTTNPRSGPWVVATSSVTSTRFKDINLLNRLQLWYRVRASDCHGSGPSSDTVPATPVVQPYAWDFARQVEGTPGTTEGWTSGQAAGSGPAGTGTTVAPGGTGKGKKKKKKAQATPQAVRAAFAGQAAPTTTPRQRKGKGAGKRARALGNGALVVSAPANAPAALSPDGLNLPAASYEHVLIDLVGSGPPTLSLRWLVIGRPGWSQPVTCTLVVTKGAPVHCEIANLGSSSHEWSGNIRRIEVSFPGARGAVSIDRIQFVGSPAHRPLVGAIRWDGWFPDNTFNDPSIYTDFDYRQPSYGWFDSPGPGAAKAGTAELPQHQLDLVQQMQEANAGGIDFWAFNWYDGQPEVPTSPNGPTPFSSAISDYNTYLAGLRPGQRPLVDYSLILGPSIVSHVDRKNDQLATDPYWSKTLIPRLIQHFRQSAYVKIDGNRPLVYWFGSDKLSSNTGFGNCSTPGGGCWRTALDDLVKQVESTPGLGAPYFVDAESDVKSAATFGFDSVTTYGPAVSGPVHYPTTSGHQAWAGASGAMGPATIDDAVARQTVIGPGGQMLAIQPPLTPTLDHRARNVGTQNALKSDSGANFWFEYPTYTQWESHVRSTYDNLMLYPGRSSDPGVTLVYAWNEISEGGGIIPTAQYGAYLLDAIRAVVTGSYPAQYWDTWNDSNPVIQYQGAWTAHAPRPDFNVVRQEQRYPTTSAPGAYTNDEHLDPNAAANAGDAATINVGDVTSVRLVATMGPDRGIAHVAVDGQGADVDLYAPTVTRQVIVFERDGLGKGAHRLTVTATGRANPKASASTIGIDAVSAQVSRLGVDASGPAAPARVSAGGFAGLVNVTWDPVPGATGYDVYRSVSPAGPWSSIHRAGSSTQTLTYVDKTVTSGMHAWYYEIRSLAGSVEGPPGDVAGAITIDALTAGGTASSGSGQGGLWRQVLFPGGAAHTVDEVVLTAPVGNSSLTIEATTDGGADWKVIYGTQPPGAAAASLGGRTWVTFLAARATGLRVVVSGAAAPPAFAAYLR